MKPKTVLEWFYDWSKLELEGTENEDKLIKLKALIDRVGPADETVISEMAWGEGTKFVLDTNPKAKSLAVVAYSAGAREYASKICDTEL